MRNTLLILCLTAAGIAAARNPDGSLGLIITPNDARPAVVAIGEEFPAILSQQASLFLVADGVERSITATWTAMPGGRWKARCELPDAITEGTYALEAGTEGSSDRSRRAVFVRAEFPRYYAAAHINAPRVGRESPGAPEAARVLRDLIRSINAADAAFLLVTGDLTEHGSAFEFAALLRALEDCDVPTFLCAGPRDMTTGVAEQFLGSQPYGFRFGEDGYIAFAMPGPEAGAVPGHEAGMLHRLLRQFKPSRWTVGFCPAYWSAADMRTQLVAFVDDPLDTLLCGTGAVALGSGQQFAPWGTTKIVPAPPMASGHIQGFDVTARGLVPRPAVRPASELAGD